MRCSAMKKSTDCPEKPRTPHAIKPATRARGTRPSARRYGAVSRTQTHRMTAPSAKRVARSGSSGPSADWAVVFITSAHRPHFAAMLAEVQKTLGTDFVAGCSAWGVLTGTEEVEGRAAIAVLAVRSDRLAASTFLATLGDDQPG